MASPLTVNFGDPACWCWATFHIAQEFKSWLEIDENLELWENWKLSASEKRDFSY